MRVLSAQRAMGTTRVGKIGGEETADLDQCPQDPRQKCGNIAGKCSEIPTSYQEFFRSSHTIDEAKCKGGSLGVFKNPGQPLRGSIGLSVQYGGSIQPRTNQHDRFIG